MWQASGVEPLLLLTIPLIVLLNKLAGLYDRDDLVLRRTTLEEAPVLAQITGVMALISWLLYDAVAAVPLTAPIVLALWGGALAVLLICRAVARRIARRLSPPERCLLIGDPRSLVAVRDKIVQSTAGSAAVVASVSLRAGAGIPHELRRRGAFGELVREHDVHRVIFAPTTTDGTDTLDLIRIAKGVGVHVSVVPRLFEVIGSSVAFDHLDGLTMLGVPRFGLSRSSRFVKRAFDLTGAGLALVVTAPLMAAIALAIRHESRGPVLFRQTRVGREGKRFTMLKFRSMIDGADELKRELAHLNESEGLFKISDDPRCTRVGRLIRRTSLDEMPQLVNVFRGEMSLVGPRPLVVSEDERVLGLDRSRLQLTPGMTGPWQVLGSARIPMAEMVGIDYLYAANWSLWADVKILLRTVPHVVSRRGM
jgi:exopolysaccharide biosynthesis polyprenyl glycosylphosphotransferase